jgi:hypothetical protein
MFALVVGRAKMSTSKLEIDYLIFQLLLVLYLKSPEAATMRMVIFILQKNNYIDEFKCHHWLQERYYIKFAAMSEGNLQSNASSQSRQLS